MRCPIIQKKAGEFAKMVMFAIKQGGKV